MTVDGFLIVACDGSMSQGGGWNALAPPPEVMRLRPDACGIDPTTGHLAFGEAKTSQDIDTGHTRQQLRVFAQLVHRRDKARCRLYLAVPRSGTVILDHVLGEIGLLGARHVVRLHIPDCFIAENSHERI